MSRLRSNSSPRPESITYVRAAMEAVVLIMVAGLPWAFGGVDPIFELLQAAGVALLLVLWATVACVNGRLSWARCPVTIVLAGLFLFGAMQLVPLPPAILKIVSPGAADLNAKLLPAAPEQLTATETSPAPSTLRPISMYPHATRVDLFHWLEVLILFGVVRHQLASTASLRRLAVVAMLSGIAIALFGLYQTFRFGGQTVYGYVTLGEVFGPFINRNHAACFLNLCLGLGIGLLAHAGSDVSEYKRRAVQKPNAVTEQDEASVFSPFSVLHSPLQLWLLVALAILLAGVMCTLSRGGVVSFFIAFFVACALRLSWPLRVRRLEFLVFPTILVVALLAWLGIRIGETRLANLWKSNLFADTRWTIWTNVITLVPSFPIAGSGYGTLQYLEPMTRHAADSMQSSAVIVDHAHNDYLEGLVEGGAIRLVLTALLVGLTFSFGFRALRRYAGRTPGAWAFGGMIAFLALVCHSAVDFSIQTPAVACLAVVVCAQLISLGRSDPNIPPSGAHLSVLTLRFSPLGLAAVAVVALTLGGVLILYAWKAEQVFRYRLATYHALNVDKPPQSEAAIAFLESAVHLDPSDADHQVELGQLYLDRLSAEHPNRKDESIIPGLRHMILARNGCPVLARPHMRLAAFHDSLAKADPAEAYWERAEILAPADPDLWYLHGVHALAAGNLDRAWSDWQKSLRLSPQHLKVIVERAYPKLGVEGLLAKILPDDPELLVRTADQLARDKPPETPPKLKPIFRRALELLDARPEEQSAKSFYLRGRCSEELGETDKALRAYRLAVDMSPLQYDWRFRYARLLHGAGKLKEALEQLERLHKERPDRADIQEEWETVKRLIEINTE